MPRFNRAEVEAARRDLIALEDKIMSQAQRSIARGLVGVLDDILEVVNGLEVGDQGELLNSLDNIARVQDMLNGLDPALQDIANKTKDQITESLADVGTEVNKIVGLAGFKEVKNRANRVDSKIINAFMGIDLKKFNGGASATTQAISDGIFNRLAGQAKRKDMVESLKRIVAGQEDRGGNPMTRHAQTWANSAIATYENAVTQQLVPPEEQGALYYAGPVDDATRDFCKEHAGKAWPREVILARIEAYAAANPSINASPELPGGWNCRHELIPVPKEEVASGAVAVEDAEIDRPITAPAAVEIEDQEAREDSFETERAVVARGKDTGERGHLDIDATSGTIAEVEDMRVKAVQGDAKKQGIELTIDQALDLVSSIGSWSRNGYIDVRRLQETGQAKSERTKKQAEDLDLFMKVSPSFPSSSPMYRGVFKGQDADGNFIDGEDFKKQVLETYKTGDVFNYSPSMSSWTDRPEVASDFGIAETEAFSVIYELTSSPTRTASVRGFSHAPEEQEIILDKNQKMRVLSVDMIEDEDSELARKYAGREGKNAKNTLVIRLEPIE